MKLGRVYESLQSPLLLSRRWRVGVEDERETEKERKDSHGEIEAANELARQKAVVCFTSPSKPLIIKVSFLEASLEGQQADRQGAKGGRKSGFDANCMLGLTNQPVCPVCLSVCPVCLSCTRTAAAANKLVRKPFPKQPSAPPTLPLQPQSFAAALLLTHSSFCFGVIISTYLHHRRVQLFAA